MIKLEENDIEKILLELKNITKNEYPNTIYIILLRIEFESFLKKIFGYDEIDDLKKSEYAKLIENDPEIPKRYSKRDFVYSYYEYLSPFHHAKKEVDLDEAQVQFNKLLDFIEDITNYKIDRSEFIIKKPVVVTQDSKTKSVEKIIELDNQKNILQREFDVNYFVKKTQDYFEVPSKERILYKSKLLSRRPGTPNKKQMSVFFNEYFKLHNYLDRTAKFEISFWDKINYGLFDDFKSYIIYLNKYERIKLKDDFYKFYMELEKKNLEVWKSENKI